VSNREYPLRPILGVAGVVFLGDSILLAKRDQEPAKGEWSLPGGVVELGESLEDAVKREFLEEVSVRVAIGGLIQLVERVLRDSLGRVQYHYVIAEYWGDVIEGRPRASSDVSEIRLVEEADLAKMDVHPDVITIAQRAVSLRRESGE
jgi:ADP-ribose pyrophosphatase YjhB (NUDIX family)